MQLLKIVHSLIGQLHKSYEHVLDICKAFVMNTMKDYHNLYLQVDFLLLSCVFESFRKESMNFCELDPAYYLSTTGYSWYAMLKFTNVDLKLFSDIEKYQLIKSTIRGSICMICKDYAEGNNIFIKSYDG